METNTYVSEIINHFKYKKCFNEIINYNGIFFYFSIKYQFEETDCDNGFHLEISTDNFDNRCTYDILFDKYFYIEKSEIMMVIIYLKNMITKDGFIYSKITDKIYDTIEEMNIRENIVKDRCLFFNIEITICSVCYDECSTTLRCGHCLCRKCSIKLSEKPKIPLCPICRKSFFKDDSDDDN